MNDTWLYGTSNHRRSRPMNDTWLYGTSNHRRSRHRTEHWLKFQNGPARRSRVIVGNHEKNKATRSPEISRQQVQKLTPQFFFIYILYWI